VGGSALRRKIPSIVICIVLILSSFVMLNFYFKIIDAADGEVLYVNETGSNGAYVTIQDAIDNASSGDTVFVYSGTYYENVVVNKTISLIGENTENTIINASKDGDVIHVNMDWVNVSGFTLVGSSYYIGDAGIELNNVENCSIKSNNIINTNFGIYLYYSDENDLTCNGLSFIGTGIYLENSDNNEIILNNASNETYYGIRLQYSNDNEITGNVASYNEYYGIYLRNSNQNYISNNNVSNNDDGINMYISNSNDLINNEVHNNDVGIFIRSSKRNNVEGCKMTSGGISIDGTSLDYWNTHTIDTSNTINWKPIYYLKNLVSGSIPNDAGQIILANCTKFRIENLNITGTYIAIHLGFSSENVISNNSISYSKSGISLSYSNLNLLMKNKLFNNYYGCGIGGRFNLVEDNRISNNYVGISLGRDHNIISNIITNNTYGIHGYCAFDNNITKNNISSNIGYGIYFHDAMRNHVYHNNFIDNYYHAIEDFSSFWDKGYPLGGNYWSDYDGIDGYKGPNQDQIGSDAIGDEPYFFIGFHKDNYPLMAPYTYEPLENYTILSEGWNLISIPSIQQNHNLQKALEMIDGWYDAVQWYDLTDTSDPWKHHKVGKPFGNDLFELNETMGFWIHITNPGDTIFLYNGTQPTVNQTITLHNGWNLVSYPSLSNKSRNEALNNLLFDTDIDAIWSYDSVNQKWEDMGESNNFMIGKGYWIHAKNDCLWEVPL
jgi:parallel beta-helix repeat protein